MGNKRLYNFDILKIFSAIIIVFHHYQQVSKVSFAGINFYGGKITWGYLVELFFIISGYLAAMTIKYDECVLKSIVKKVIRLLPMAFLSVLANYIVSLIYHCFTGKLLFDESYSLAQVLTSLFLVNQGWVIEFFPAINNPIWYLCVLVWVSIIYIVIRHVVKQKKTIEIFISLIFVVLGIVGYRMNTKYGFDLPFLHMVDFRGYAAFFMGVCLYHLSCKVENKFLFLISISSLIVSVIGMAILGISSWYVLVVFFYPSIVLFAVAIPQVSLESLSFLGGGSYEVYLWHMPIYCFLKMIIDISGMQITHTYLTMFIFCLFVWLIAFLMYKYVEIFFNKKINIVLNKIR